MDSSGDSILICKPTEVRRAREITGSAMEPIKSCLWSSASDFLNSVGQKTPNRSLKRILFEV